jgi:hypothetical protein
MLEQNYQTYSRQIFSDLRIYMSQSLIHVVMLDNNFAFLPKQIPHCKFCTKECMFINIKVDVKIATMNLHFCSTTTH